MSTCSCHMVAKIQSRHSVTSQLKIMAHTGPYVRDECGSKISLTYDEFAVFLCLVIRGQYCGYMTAQWYLYVFDIPTSIFSMSNMAVKYERGKCFLCGTLYMLVIEFCRYAHYVPHGIFWSLTIGRTYHQPNFPISARLHRERVLTSLWPTLVGLLSAGLLSMSSAYCSRQALMVPLINCN